MSGQNEVEEMCKWLRETKGITKIDLLELAEYTEEFNAYKAQQGDFSKVDENDIGV